ncbi:mannosyl-3-phosphoglycerate phosphatase [Halarcobacter ebronensis]|uniref:Mannosyl-3-phosphoglycerate phosphatase n=1 Tax=Halarcobacter ebronensis TaxID=1462615 RepID=A0A4Q0YIJ8_9BACT|nr:HAD-IIB family hydrolase [Halarcobacter ebronensis]RXJ69624.1 mannosyl-3-phosphoglycerate phosphatase [Halarcobacter ebronensis]
MKTVIYTDLDGTFLNHDDYSFEDSKKALEKIKQRSIPLLFTTSKTRLEVEVLQKKVGIKEPFIIENGAAIFFPKNYQGFDLSFLDSFDNYFIKQLGLTYQQILNFYNRYKDEFKMFGFSDMSIDEIIKFTGLDEEGAIFAKKRDFTEPFILKDESKLENLRNLAATYRIKITKGGRFYHLIGQGQDKGIAVKKANEIFKSLYNEEINSIGLGDGENDTPMFENVKNPVIIKNYENSYVNFNSKEAKKSTFKGSKGWNEMVLKYV